mmetsp:Transcript_15992/g.34810  ORF Transcript_15992/g.34810 Transcript_15992/m.34810 type:complete len:229 (+) Transcript_15992:1150-1836(+)
MLAPGLERRPGVLLRHGDEAEPARVASVALSGDVALQHTVLPVKLRKEVIELIGHRFVREVSDVQFDGRGAFSLVPHIGVVNSRLVAIPLPVSRAVTLASPLLCFLWKRRFLRFALRSALNRHSFLWLFFRHRRRCDRGRSHHRLHLRNHDSSVVQRAPEFFQLLLHLFAKHVIRRHDIQGVLERPHVSIVKSEHATVRSHRVITVLDLHRAVPSVGVEKRLPAHEGA